MAYSNSEMAQLLGTVGVNFQQEIAQKFLPYDAWLSLMEREVWPAGTGDTLSFFKTEVTFASDETTWHPVVQTSDTFPNETVLIGDEVPTSQTVLNVSMEQKALNSDDIELVKTGLAFQFRQQLQNTLTNFERAIGRVWSLYSQNRYELLVNNKLVAAPGIPNIAGSGETFIQAFNANGGPTPTGILNSGVTDYIYDQMTYQNADMDGAYGELDGAPVFLLMSDQHTLRNIIKQDGATRQDYRFADPGELLKPMGVGRVYNGFYHYQLRNQNRYNIVNGQLVPVPQYVPLPTTYGYKMVFNPSWQYAFYGVSYVFHRKVMHIMVPDLPSDLGSQVSYPPQNYMGEVDFKLYGITPDHNPDGDIGRYRARMLTGAKPIFTELGYAILHLICPGDNYMLSGCIGSS